LKDTQVSHIFTHQNNNNTRQTRHPNKNNKGES
jgi:hypothetical protein